MGKNEVMKRFFSFIIKTTFFAGIIAGCALAIWGRADFQMGQTFNREFLRYPIIFTDKNGIEIHRIFGNENREWSRIENMPQSLQNATILAEDRRFQYHFGVDLYGLSRAMWINFKAGRFEQGASTLTQQIARKAFLTDEKSIHRKLREMFLAMGIEQKLSKSEILEMYLNTVPYGARVNGIGVAAKFYFKKKPSELTEAEGLVLTMLPQNPVVLSRNTKVENWLGSCPEATDPCDIFQTGYQTTRIEKIMLALAKKENWDRSKTKEVWEELKGIRLPRRHNWAHSDFQHFQFYVRNYLAKNGAEFSSIRDGIVIQTSLDSTLQQEISHYLREEKANDLQNDHEISNTAFMILNNESRKPEVWIGSQYYWDQDIGGQIDMLQSDRQVGSTMKPFIYAAAIENGYQPPTIFYDSTLYFRTGASTVRNADGHYLGGIRMTDALAKSRNIPAAKALILAGGEKKIRSYLDKKFGFEINKRFGNHAFGWTISLGTAPIELNKLANAYATLATGDRKDICPIISVKTFGGKNLGNFCKEKTIAKVSDTTRFFINDILSNEYARPKAYNWRKNLTVPNYNIAAKTGTSSKRVRGVLLPADDLVVGYSPKHTFLMWGGNTNGKALKGGSVSVIALGGIWNEIVQKFYDKNPNSYAKFSIPKGIQQIHGEWATTDYVPPSYDRLDSVVWKNKEKGLNPMLQLKARAKKNKDE